MLVPAHPLRYFLSNLFRLQTKKNNYKISRPSTPSHFFHYCFVSFFFSGVSLGKQTNKKNPYTQKKKKTHIHKHMTSFFFNLIRGSPLSPSAPDDKPKGQGICDYCGVFDANCMKWSSALSPTSPALAKRKSNRDDAKHKASAFSANNHQDDDDGANFQPVFADFSCRNRDGVARGFIERHIKICLIDQEYREMVRKSKKIAGENAQASEATDRTSTTRPRKSNADNDDDSGDHDDDDDDSGKESASSRPKRPIRVVAISDTHQYHQCLTVPLGDVLLVCGDILLSDRLNPQVISNYYIKDFIQWLDEQPHKVKIFLNGNHCCQFALLGEEKIRELCDELAVKHPKSIFYLTGDEIFDVYGVRFYGNSISFGNSPNKAFQNKDTLDRLKKIPHDKVVDCVKIVNDAKKKATTANKQNTERRGTDGATSSSSPPLLPRRPDDSRAIDVLATHSRLLGPEGDAIVKACNPVVHCVGHEHENHGMSLGVVDRASSWISNVQNSFTRRSTISTLWGLIGGMMIPNNDAAATSSTTATSIFEPIKHIYIDSLVPEINVCVVGDLQRWRPALQPPCVFDVLPFEV